MVSLVHSRVVFNILIGQHVLTSEGAGQRCHLPCSRFPYLLKFPETCMKKDLWDLLFF